MTLCLIIEFTCSFINFGAIFARSGLATKEKYMNKYSLSDYDAGILIKDIKTAIETLKQDLGRTPTNQEIADYVGIDKDKVFAYTFQSPI